MKFLTLALLLSASASASEFVVKYRSSQAISKLKEIQGAKILHHHPAGHLLKVELSDKALKNELLAMDEIELVAPNLSLMVERVRAEEAPVLWSLNKVRAEAAWELAGSRGSKSITVAVIDTGVDYTHPALAANTLRGHDFQNDRPDGMDAESHGTHCAGIIAANPSTKEAMSGISPGVTILPLRFLGPRGLGSFYDGIRASDYAVEKQVDIISASWGAHISDPALAQILSDMVGRADAAGVLFVTAAGNLSRDNDVIPYFPANAPYRGVIAVGGSDPSDKKMSMSHFGTNVHIAAPGENIWSTIPKRKYKSLSGTSMATPMVAGLAALMKSVNPKLTAAEIRDIMQETGEKIDMDNACNCRIDAARAIERTVIRSAQLE